MDAKTVLAIALALYVAGHTVQNLLQILGLTKTQVLGGQGSSVLHVLASATAVIGATMFLIILMFQGDVVLNALSCIVGF